MNHFDIMIYYGGCYFCSLICFMEYIDRCYDYQCLNGGQCVENNGLPECRCSRQYHGCHCEQKGEIMISVDQFNFRCDGWY